VRPVSPHEGALWQEYDKHRQMCKDNMGKVPAQPAYQFLAIYEIVSIKRVAGGIRTTQPHWDPKVGSPVSCPSAQIKRGGSCHLLPLVEFIQKVKHQRRMRVSAQCKQARH